MYKIKYTIAKINKIGKSKQVFKYYLVTPSPGRNITSGLPPRTLPRPPVPSIGSLAVQVMMMVMVHVIVVAAAGIVRGGHMAAILPLFHAPILLLWAPANLLLLLLLRLLLRRLLHGYRRVPLPVVLVRASRARRFPPRPVTMARRWTQLNAVPVRIRAPFHARAASQKVEGERLPSSAPLLLGPTAQIRRRLGVTARRGAVAFLQPSFCHGLCE